MKQYTLGIYEKAMPEHLSWEEKLLAAKDAGYDFVEISIDETPKKLSRLDMPERERLELVKTMSKVGIPVRTMCLSGHRKYPLGSNERKISQKSMEIIEKAIHLADDLGIRIIQLAGYDVYYEKSTAETQIRFQENLQKAVMMAAAVGIIMGFETMETEFMDTVEKAMLHVKQVNSAYLNVYPDAGNITNSAVAYKTDVLQDIRKGAGHMVAMHLKETVPGRFREIPFGTGHVDFKTIIETAWNSGVRKYVTEFWYTGSDNWAEDLIVARKMFGDILDMQELLDKESKE